MSQLLDRMERVRGLPVLVGVALVVLNFVLQLAVHLVVPDAQRGGLLLFLLTDGNFFLHLGVLIGFVGLLIGDVL
jgi:hypothetical protein